MIYLIAQFKTKVLFKKSPWTSLEFAESVGVADEIKKTYVIEDDGPNHIRISQDGTAVRVPWSNVAAVSVDMTRLAGVTVTTESIAPADAIAALVGNPTLFGVSTPEAETPEPKGFKPLPRKGPRR